MTPTATAAQQELDALLRRETTVAGVYRVGFGYIAAAALCRRPRRQIEQARTAVERRVAQISGADVLAGRAS